MTTDRGLAVGETAPSFTAPLVFPDGSVEQTSLESLLEDRPVLLSFYTNDFSPDCIDEWCSFRDLNWFSAGEAVQVVGISKSRVKTHEKFLSYLDLQFPLYADTDLAVADKYAVTYRVLKIVRRPHRSCFLIDGDRQIRYKWVGEHPLDPTLDTPPVEEIRDAISQKLDHAEPQQA
jgi:peroxiredoxin Q/BCP